MEIKYDVQQRFYCYKVSQHVCECIILLNIKYQIN